MADETYNGWTNKPTWLVKLWIDNEQAAQEMWLNSARRCIAASERKTADTYILTPPERAEYMLARLLEDEIEIQCSIRRANLASDLMSWALAHVNWHEIARALIEDAAKVPA